MLVVMRIQSLFEYNQETGRGREQLKKLNVFLLDELFMCVY